MVISFSLTVNIWWSSQAETVLIRLRKWGEKKTTHMPENQKCFEKKNREEEQKKKCKYLRATPGKHARRKT